MPKSILLLDSATPVCTVALQIGEQCFQAHNDIVREHNRVLLPMIQALIAEANISLNDLDMIAFGRGPGSFVGVRLVVGVVQGLAFGLDLPVLPISSLQLLAQTAYVKHGVEHALVAMDAHMGDVYWGAYRLNNGTMEAVIEDQASKPEAVRLPEQGEWTTVGNGWPLCSLADSRLLHSARAVNGLPDAAAAMRLAESLGSDALIKAEAAQPVYLRQASLWEKSGKKNRQA